MSLCQRLLITLALFVLAASPLSAAPAAKPAAPAKKASQVTLDFKDIELTDLIQTISELTGKNFVYDDTVKGKVTIISPRGMALNEAYQVFLTVLNVKGFTIVPAGKSNKIVRTQEARENSLPTGLDSADRGGEEYVTRLVPLKHIDAALLATSVLTPLVPKSSSIVPYAPTNTLIITDSVGNIERLLKIIAELDVPGTGDNLEIIFLSYASADEVAQIGSQVLAQSATSPRRSRSAAGGQAAAGGSPGKVIPFARANAIVVIAEAAEIDTIRALVATLDRKPETERSNINVYYLENADAESLAKTLNEILTGNKQKPKGAGSAEAMTITADKATNSLVINANPEDSATIHGIIKKLDIKRKQVFVEALILELSMEATQNLGISLSGGVALGDDGGIFGAMNQAVNPFSDSSLLTTSVDGVMAGGFSNLISIPDPSDSSKTIRVPALSALIKLSKKDGDVNVLSAPRLLTSDNEEAQIVVGSNVPIITSRLTSGASSDLNQSVSVERKDVALTLKFTPQITEGDLVRLKIYQEITGVVSTDSSASVGDVNQVGPTFTKRLLQNTVVAEDGKTVVLGGLISNTTTESVSKVPWLGDIPFLGWLFKTKDTREKKTNLLVFITPRIIRNADDLAQVTRKSRDAMNEFRKSEMKHALKAGSYAARALEEVIPAEAATAPEEELPEAAPETPPHE